MRGKNPSAQALNIGLLEHLDTGRRRQIRIEARARLSDIAMEQMSLCMQIASERNQNECRPHRQQGGLPRSFIAFAQMLLALQQGRRSEEITLPEIYLAMKQGTVDKETAKKSAGTILRRIEGSERMPLPEEIDGLCAGFDLDSERLFWCNEIYRMFPNLPVADVEGGPVMEALQVLWDGLSADEQARMRTTFPQQEYWFKQLGGKAQRVNGLNASIFQLYDFVDKRRNQLNLSQEALCEGLNIQTTDTYRSYRNEWNRFEADVRRATFPRRRLSREQMLCLVVLLQLDYPTAVLVLGAGGYCLQDGEADCAVAAYLQRSEAERARRTVQQAVLGKLKP